MSTRPASPLSVARWKFVLGAILLLAVAVTVLLLGESPPGVGTMIIVVICLGGSVALSVAPSLVEYEGRLRLAEAQARDHIESQIRRLTQTTEQLTNAISRSQSTEEQAGQALGALEELTEKLTAQADELAQGLARANEREFTALKAEVERAQRERDERLSGLDQHLENLAAQWAESQQAARKLSAANGKILDELKERMIALAARLDAGVAAESARQPAPAHQPAVSPAMGPAPVTEDSKPAAMVAPSRAAVLLEDASASAGASPLVHVEIASTHAGHGSGDASMQAVAATLSAPAPAHAPVPVPVPKPRVRRAPEPAPSVASRIPVKPQPMELPLLGGSDIRPVARRDASGGTATLVATAYIGIGNKLYVRGDGPGLNWDHGVPMQFLAIGKWGWTSPDAGAPITCRIYRNDDTPMLDENITIEPGAKAEITPRF